MFALFRRIRQLAHRPEFERRDHGLRISARSDQFSLCRFQLLNKREYAIIYPLFSQIRMNRTLNKFLRSVDCANHFYANFLSHERKIKRYQKVLYFRIF
jgi:hypothetical protein